MPCPPRTHRLRARPTRPFHALAFAATLAGTLVGLPGMLRADPVVATYRVQVGGVAVLDVLATLDLTDRAYRLEVTAMTGGFLGRIFPWRTVSRSEGAVRPDGLAPTHHSQSSVFREKPRNVTLDYDGQGNVVVSVTPPPEEDDREPVPDAQRHATYDPLTAFLTVMTAAGRGEACTRSLPVYDGRRRYDMIFEDVGQRLVGVSRYSIFAGSARQCRVTYRPVAGYSRVSPSGGLWPRDRETAQRPPAELWIAPVVPGVPPLPVRLETESDLGAVIIHLTSLKAPNAPPLSIPQ